MAEEYQEKFRREFGQIKSGNPKRKSKMQLYTIKNFARFTGKHLCQNLFLNKVAGCTLLKKEPLAQVFSYEFCKISKSTFLQSMSGRLFLKLGGLELNPEVHHILQSCNQC